MVQISQDAINMGTENGDAAESDLSTRIGNVESMLLLHEDRVAAVEEDVDNVAVMLMKEGLEREIQQGKSMLKISKFPWKWEEIKPKTKDVNEAFAKKEQFWRRIIKEVFVNSNLVSQKEADDQGMGLLTDVKPASWSSKPGGALDITFSDRTLRHNIMDRLAGRKDIRFGIRAWLPPILNARYNELLRIRGELGKGQIFVDIVAKPPYVILRRKERQPDNSFKRFTLPVTDKLHDKRLDDPVKHFTTWSYQSQPLVEPLATTSSEADAPMSSSETPMETDQRPTTMLRQNRDEADVAGRGSKRLCASAYGDTEQRQRAQSKGSAGGNPVDNQTRIQSSLGNKKKK
jgi:hypothetical protein